MDRIVSRETNDLIAAVATAPGRSGIGVIRVSGPDVSAVAHGLLGKLPEPRKATYSPFLDKSGQPLDAGIVLRFVAPNSYTGEAVLELQGHGGSAVLESILYRCLELGCRLARPGEFTERAFLNGRLDLAEAEAVADLIEASSTEAAKSAVRTLTGEFSRRVHDIVGRVTELRVHVEACIDFPEEEIDPADRQEISRKLACVRAAVEDLLKEARQGVVLRDGLTVVLIGKPNVGKSSLLNRLSGEERAIVTPIPGTTRDQVRATIHLSGVPIHLVDTAGLRETDDPVESIGIARTWEAVRQAGAAVLIMEAGEAAARAEMEILSRLPQGLPTAWVYNKIDLYEPIAVSRETLRSDAESTFRVSAQTGEGLDEFREWLLKTAGWQPGQEGVFLARARHLAAMQTARTRLAEAASHETMFELFAEELRLAQRDLASITGEFTADDLLGEIFSRFCIGK